MIYYLREMYLQLHSRFKNDILLASKVKKRLSGL